MKGPTPHPQPTNPLLAHAIAQARTEGAESSEHAMIIGDRTGLVEWANAAWSQITGIPPGETLQKPISHFLDVAEIDLELVDFVGQHFLEGRTCMIAFPFETFDQRQIQVHLEVRPIRKAAGELDGFLAVARAATRRNISGSALSLRSSR